MDNTTLMGLIAIAVVILAIIGFSTRNRNPVFYVVFLISAAANAWFWYEAGSALGVGFAVGAAALGLSADVLKVQHQGQKGFNRAAMVWVLRLVSIYAGYSAAHMALEQHTGGAINNSAHVATLQRDIKAIEIELESIGNVQPVEIIKAESSAEIDRILSKRVYDANGKASGTLRGVSCTSGYYAKRYASDCERYLSAQNKAESAVHLSEKYTDLVNRRKKLESEVKNANGGSVAVLPVVRDISELWFGVSFDTATSEQKQQLVSGSAQVFAIIMALVFELTLILAGLENSRKGGQKSGFSAVHETGTQTVRGSHTTGTPAGRGVPIFDDISSGTVIDIAKDVSGKAIKALNKAGENHIKKSAIAAMDSIEIQKVADLTEITDTGLLETLSVICRQYDPEKTASLRGIKSGMERSGLKPFGSGRISSGLETLARSGLFVVKESTDRGNSYTWKDAISVARDLGIADKSVASLAAYRN